MAGSSFGEGGGGGKMDLRRIFSQPVVLLLIGAMVIAVGFFWWHNRSQSGAPAGVVNPVTGAMESGDSDVLATAQLNGIQQQLSNLLQQISTVGNQPTSTSPPTPTSAPPTPAPTVTAGNASAIWKALGNSSPTPPGSIADIEIGNLEWNALHPGANAGQSGQALWNALGNAGSVPNGADLLTTEQGNVFWMANQGQLSQSQLDFIRQNHLVPGL